jgi:hypothetical protein
VNLFRAAAAAVALSPGVIAAQGVQPPAPIVELGAVEATSTERLRGTVVLHALSNGSLLAGDAVGRRILLFDNTLGLARVVMDSAQVSTGPLGAIPISRLLPFLGDSALFVDLTSQSLLVLGPDGNVARVMAFPGGTNDIMWLAGLAGGGGGAVDPRGRIVYRAQFRQPPMAMGPGGGMMIPEQPDSAPIVRADFDTRQVDTVAVIKIPLMARPAQREFNPNSPQSSMRIIVNPMASGDEWALLSDGTLALVRTSDYHVDWVDFDGTQRSTPRMRFDWRRATDEDKQAKIDSLRVVIDSAAAAQRSQMQAAGRGSATMMVPDYTFAPLNEMPDYHPPIRPGSVMADRDGRLWIVPTTSSDAKGGLLYDVVRRSGEVAARVQLPPNRVVVGFGPMDVVYLLRSDDGTPGGVLERARVSIPR